MFIKQNASPSTNAVPSKSRKPIAASLLQVFGWLGGIGASVMFAQAFYAKAAPLEFAWPISALLSSILCYGAGAALHYLARAANSLEALASGSSQK